MQRRLTATPDSNRELFDCEAKRVLETEQESSWEPQEGQNAKIERETKKKSNINKKRTTQEIIMAVCV